MDLLGYKRKETGNQGKASPQIAGRSPWRKDKTMLLARVFSPLKLVIRNNFSQKRAFPLKKIKYPDNILFSALFGF